MTDDQEVALVRAWEAEHHAAALKEGWSVFDCSGSSYGRWQICRFDDPPEGSVDLDSDDEAWKLVVGGNEPHHIAAFELIRQVNPGEFKWWAGASFDRACVRPEVLIELVTGALSS